MRESHIRRVLGYIANRPECTQRKVAADLGIALGLANGVLRRLLESGLIDRSHSSASRKITYLITERGRAEHERMSRAHLRELMESYSEARGRIRLALARLRGAVSGGATGRIVFFASPEVAEIGFLCLRESGLQLVGIIDDHPHPGRTADAVMGNPVYSTEDLCGCDVDGVAFDSLVVLSTSDPETIRQRLMSRGVPPQRV